MIEPLRRPVLMYAAQCPFCCWCARKVELLDRRESLAFVALDDPIAEDLLPNLTFFERAQHWHLVETDGTDLIEGEALLRLLEILPWTRWVSALFRRLSLETPATRFDRMLTDHRKALGVLGRECVPPIRFP